VPICRVMGPPLCSLMGPGGRTDATGSEYAFFGFFSTAVLRLRTVTASQTFAGSWGHPAWLGGVLPGQLRPCATPAPGSMPCLLVREEDRGNTPQGWPWPAPGSVGLTPPGSSLHLRRSHPGQTAWAGPPSLGLGAGGSFLLPQRERSGRAPPGGPGRRRVRSDGACFMTRSENRRPPMGVSMPHAESAEDAEIFSFFSASFARSA